MNEWKNLVRRKFDYKIDIGNYSLGINRDFNLVIDEDTVNYKVLNKTLQEMYPEWTQWKAVRDHWDPKGTFRSSLGERLGLTL